MDPEAEDGSVPGVQAALLPVLLVCLRVLAFPLEVVDRDRGRGQGGERGVRSVMASGIGALVYRGREPAGRGKGAVSPGKTRAVG